MGLGNLIKKAVMSDDDVKTAAVLGDLAKKAGKGIAGAGFALGDKLKNKDDQEKSVEQPVETVPTEVSAPIAEPTPISEPSYGDVPSYEPTPSYEPIADTKPVNPTPVSEPVSTSSSTFNYTLDMSHTTVRCPECGAVVDSKAEKCSYCNCQIAGNPNARSGPL